MTTGNTNPKNPTAFPGFPTVFGDKEQKRMQDLQQQQTQMQQIYNQKFTSTAWQGVNPVEKAIRNIPIVRNLVSAVTPWQSGWDYGFTPAQAQQKLNDTAGQYLELVRSQKVTNLLPDIEQNMLNAALAGKPMQKESDYLPSGLGSDFNNAEKVYLANMAAKIASASREQLLSGDIFNVVPSSETANFTDVSNSPTMANVSPQYILSSVAFSKNVGQISDALKEAYPPMPTQEGKDIMDFQSKETQTVDALRERAKELGIPGADVLAPDELVKRVGDQLAKTNEGQTKIMVDQKTSAMVPVTMKDDGTVWFKGEYMGTFDDKTGKVVSNYAKDYDEMKTAFPSMSDDQIDQILQQASPKPSLPQTPETTAQVNNFINPITGEMDFSSIKTGVPTFTDFKKAWDAKYGTVVQTTPQTGNHPVTSKVVTGSAQEAVEANRPIVEAYKARFGDNAFTRSEIAMFSQIPLPTVSKLVNPEKPKINWYDPLFDIATVSSLGTLGAPIGGVRTGLQLLASTSALVGQSANTAANWNNNPDWLNVVNIGLAGLVASGFKFSVDQVADEVFGASFRKSIRSWATTSGISMTQDEEDQLVANFLKGDRVQQAKFASNTMFRPIKGSVEGSYEVTPEGAASIEAATTEEVNNVASKVEEAKGTMPTYEEVKANLPSTVQESIDQKTSLLVNKRVPQDQAEGLAFKEATSTEAGKSQVANAVTAADRTIPTSKTALDTQIARLNTKINNTAEHLAVWQSSYAIQANRLTQMQDQNKVGYEIQEQQTQVANIKRNIEGLQTQLGTLGKSLKILQGSKVAPIQPTPTETVVDKKGILRNLHKDIPLKEEELQTIIADVQKLYPEATDVSVVGTYARTNEAVTPKPHDIDILIKFPEGLDKYGINARHDEELWNKWGHVNGKWNIDFIKTFADQQHSGVGQHLNRLEQGLPTPEVKVWSKAQPTPQVPVVGKEASVVPNPTNETVQVAPTPSTIPPISPPSSSPVDISTTWDSLTPDQRLVKIADAGIAKTASGKNWADLTDVQQARLGGTPEVVESTHQKLGNFEIMEDANGEVIICD